MLAPRRPPTAMVAPEAAADRLVLVAVEAMVLKWIAVKRIRIMHDYLYMQRQHAAPP